MDRDLLCGGGIAPQLASAPNQRLLKLALVLIAFALATATAASAQTYNYPESSPVSGGGTLNWTLSEQMGYCGSEYQDVTDTFENFSYTPATGSATGLSGSIYYLYGCDAGWGNVQGGWDGPGGGDNELDLTYTYCTVAFDAYIGGGGNASLDCPPLSNSTFDPAYKVASILYSPPGNKSSQGYATATTNGATTTVGSSFTYGEQFTFTHGVPDVYSVGGSVGYSVSNGNSSAYTQTFTNTTSIASSDNSNYTDYNPTQSNALNANLDTFEIWLNPQVTTATAGSTPVNYTVNSIPITLNNESIQYADILGIPAIAMEAQPASAPGTNPLDPAGTANVSGVLYTYLVPQALAQENGSNVYQPGLGAVCANQTLYQETLTANWGGNPNPGICNQSNQCGCQPSDFAAIEKLDPLLNYNATTYTASPGNGTGTPLAEDALATTSGPGSGESVCGYDQPAGYTIPNGSNCRYVTVPITTGEMSPFILPLDGDEVTGKSQQDTTNSTFTTTEGNSYSVGLALQEGPASNNLREQFTWTWTDMEGIGTSVGGSNTMSLTLNTSTAGCVENVSLYEDTLFHTYAFQIPTGIAGCP